MNIQQTLALHEAGENANREPVVILHGLFGNAGNFGALTRALSRQFRVLALDLPGHGESPHFESYSFDAMAEAVWQTLAARDISHFDLLGHSLGGKVAMALALKWPESVGKLVVADIAPVRYAPRHEAVFEALLRVEPSNMESRAQAEAILAETLTDRSLRQFLLQNLRRAGDTYSWRFDLAGLRRSYAELSSGLSAAAGSYTGPALFIAGERSDYLLPEHETGILALFPNARFERIAKAGHWLHAEQPQVFAGLVENFLANE